MEVAKATQQTIANAQQRPGSHPSQQLPHTTKPAAAATAFAPAVSSFNPGFSASSSGAARRVPGDHPSGPSLGNPASPMDLTAIDDKRHQRTMHVMGDAAGATRFEELAHVAPEETPQGRDGGEFSPDLLHSLLS